MQLVARGQQLVQGSVSAWLRLEKLQDEILLCDTHMFVI